MAEYIDKADLVKRLENRVKDYGRDCNSNAPIISGTYQAVLHMVENLPTADVVSVVRCKDCKRCEHFYPECDINGNHREAYYCKSIKGDVKPDDYCCWGERRSNDD